MNWAGYNELHAMADALGKPPAVEEALAQMDASPTLPILQAVTHVLADAIFQRCKVDLSHEVADVYGLELAAILAEASRSQFTRLHGKIDRDCALGAILMRQETDPEQQQEFTRYFSTQKYISDLLEHSLVIYWLVSMGFADLAHRMRFFEAVPLETPVQAALQKMEAPTFVPHAPAKGLH